VTRIRIYRKYDEDAKWTMVAEAIEPGPERDLFVPVTNRFLGEARHFGVEKTTCGWLAYLLWLLRRLYDPRAVSVKAILETTGDR